MDTLKLINEFSSLILVIATVIYVIFTFKLSQETTKLREVETSPFISLTLEPLGNSMMLKLVIKNIGKAPAYKIDFSVNEKYKGIFRYNFENKISYFAPNQEITIFGKQYGEFENLEYDNIPITVTYYSKEDKYFNEVFKLEWQYLSETILGTDNIVSIDNNLKDISNFQTLMESNRYGVKDILVDGEYLYVVIAEIDLNQNDKCKTIKIYRSKLGDSQLGDGGLNFNLFFNNEECTDGYNPHAAGGRLVKYSENELILSTGDWLNEKKISQDDGNITEK